MFLCLGIKTELLVFCRTEWLKQFHSHQKWQQHCITGVDIKIQIISCLAPFSLGKIIEVKRLAASLKGIASSEMNRRGVCLVLTLCEETFRALKKWDSSQGIAMFKSLPSDDFKETNEIKKTVLWQSELEWMPSTEIYVYIWVKSHSVLCPKRNNSYTYRQAVGTGSRTFLC